MLTLGYKASAEQFAPAKLLDFGILAEQAGFDILLHLATTSSPGSTPTAMRPIRWPGSARSAPAPRSW